MRLPKWTLFLKPSRLVGNFGGSVFNVLIACSLPVHLYHAMFQREPLHLCDFDLH